MAYPWVSVLLAVNLALQVWDGLATYYGLSLGVSEGNPLLRLCMGFWDVGVTLVGAKSAACLFLVYLHNVTALAISQWGLLLTTACYFVFSFVPWAVLLLR